MLGHVIKLDDTRFVFLGVSESKPGLYFLGFRNYDGQDTKLMFSPEALTALVKLATETPKTERVEFPHKMVWRVVQEGEMP